MKGTQRLYLSMWMLCVFVSVPTVSSPYGCGVDSMWGKDWVRESVCVPYSVWGLCVWGDR